MAQSTASGHFDHLWLSVVKIPNLGIFTYDVWYAIKMTAHHLGKGQPCLAVDNLSTTTESAVLSCNEQGTCTASSIQIRGSRTL